MLKLEMPKEITVQAEGFDEFILHYLSTKESEISDVARRLQLGHALSSGDSNSYHYQSWRSNETKLIERLRRYHVSPLSKLAEAGRWDWTLWPVHHVSEDLD